jgi:hypothetical protein
MDNLELKELEIEQLQNFVANNLDLTVTLGEILEAWGDSYGENIVAEYSSFIQTLIKNK